MGNSLSAGAGATPVEFSTTLPPVSRGTERLHLALDTMWDAKKLSQSLSPSAGASASAFRPVDSNEQFVIFCPSAERTSASAFALTALGRFVSNLLSHMVARETGVASSMLDRDTPPRVLSALLAAGADAGAPLHATVPRLGGGGVWKAGEATLVDALRLIIDAVKKQSDERRRARAAFLEPTLIVALGCLPYLTALDLCFWSAHHDVMALIVTRNLPILTPRGEFVPSLIAAVDAGSAATLKALLEAGADPNAEGMRTLGGATPLMRAAGSAAFATPTSSGSFGAHTGKKSVNIGGVGAAEEEAAAEEEEAAADRPTRALVEALLHAGADVHAVDHSGSTALHAFAGAEALKSDPGLRLAIALRLLDAGAHVESKDAGGRTPADIAQSIFPKDAARFVRGIQDRKINAQPTPSKSVSSITISSPAPTTITTSATTTASE